MNIHLKPFRNVFMSTGFTFMGFVAKIAFWLEFCNNTRVKTLIYYQFLSIVNYFNFQADRFYFFSIYQRVYSA